MAINWEEVVPEIVERAGLNGDRWKSLDSCHSEWNEIGGVHCTPPTFTNPAHSYRLNNPCSLFQATLGRG
jgi:hypothetical protein